jgi:hypothetical protein
MIVEKVLGMLNIPSFMYSIISRRLTEDDIEFIKQNMSKIYIRRDMVSISDGTRIIKFILRDADEAKRFSDYIVQLKTPNFSNAISVNTFKKNQFLQQDTYSTGDQRA